MKHFLNIFLLISFFGATVQAQVNNTFIFDFQNNKFTAKPPTYDFGKAWEVTWKNIPQNQKYTLTAKNGSIIKSNPDFSPKPDEPMVLETSFINLKPASGTTSTITLFKGTGSIKVFTVILKPGGTIEAPKDKPATTVKIKPIGIKPSETEFVPKEYYDKVPSQKESDEKCKELYKTIDTKTESNTPSYINVVQFYPGCDFYSINGYRNEFGLKYGSRFPKGVQFRIENLNTFKYDIGSSTSFESYNETEPEQFKNFYTGVSGLVSLQSTAEERPDTQAVLEVLGEILKLNQDLSQYFQAKKHYPVFISADDFNKERDEIQKNIQQKFGLQSGFDFESKYKQIRDVYIEAKGGKYKEETFDSEFGKLGSDGKIKTSAGNLVTETRNLLYKLNYASFSYTSPTIELENADELIIKLSITPREGVPKDYDLPEGKIKIPIYGGFKIDFSTGFYYSSLRSKKFGLKPFTADPTNTDSVKRNEIFEEEVGSISGTFGVTALMHAYRRCKGPVGWAGTLGVGAAPNLNYSILLGGSVLFGRKNRLVLSGGANFSSVRALSNAYENVNGSMVVNESVTEVPLYSRVKFGYFLSLTYNIGGVTPSAQEITAPVETSDDSASEDQDGESEDENTQDEGSDS